MIDSYQDFCQKAPTLGLFPIHYIAILHWIFATTLLI